MPSGLIAGLPSSSLPIRLTHVTVAFGFGLLPARQNASSFVELWQVGNFCSKQARHSPSPALQAYDALPAASDWPADDVPAFSEQPADDVSALPEQADVSDDFDDIDKHRRFETCYSAPRQTSINEAQVADAFSFHLLLRDGAR